MLFVCVFMGMAVSCQSPSDEPQAAEISGQMQVPSYAEDTLVTIHFANREIFMHAMTRGDISEAASHLDMWLSDGTTTTEIHQASTDADFGTASVTLNKTKTYTLYAMAHKGAAAATLTDGVISFPDDKVKDSFWYTTSFSPATTTTVDATLNRIVAQFQFTTADAVPDWCKTMRFTIHDVYDRWSVTDGATHQLDRVSTFQNFSTKADGTVTFTIYAIVSDASTTHDILVEALDANGDVCESHTFSDVPLQVNHRTVATGTFFSDAAETFSFSTQDWSDDIPYSF